MTTTDYSYRIRCKSCENGAGPNGCTDCLGRELDPAAFAGGVEGALNDAYVEGRKDEREQWEPVARLALAALNSCDGAEGDKGYQQWFHDEQVSDAIKKLCALICPVCLGAGWTAERVGEPCPCGLYSWEARK